MQYDPFVTETHLHQKADFAESQGIIPKVLYKLITASIQRPTELRIPSVYNQAGWDGIVESPIPFEPFVPTGKSFWEIGNGNDPAKKAGDEFRKRTKTTDGITKSESTFVFVTSRSASRCDWDITKQAAWKKRRLGRGWKEIKVIDATKLEHWLSKFPEIDLWLAKKYRLTTRGFDSPILFWKQLKNLGGPPYLRPIIFTDGREKVINEILKVFRRETRELRIESKFPAEVIDIVVAILEDLPKDEQYAYAGRCLIIDNEETWKEMCYLNEYYILLAKPSLDLDGIGVELRNLAMTEGKGVIYSTTPLPSVHGNSIKLPEMKQHQLYKNLQTCGYKEERARQISERCRGNIPVLKRILLDLSASPVWAASDAASELAIATLIGRWNANEEGDIEAVTGILGKEYGEWIQKIRPMTVDSDPPLIQQNEKWHFISRYEGWQNLGKFIFDDDLNKFSEWTIKVLRERNPKFDLPKDEQWLASTKGKKKNYSETLMMGLSETLALIGTYPTSLPSVSTTNAELIVARTVREIFKEADWKNWATLNNYLPLIAEADPDTYLDCLEDIIEKREIISNLFSQEGTGITGWNYMTGILWSLEALAWSEKYLTRVSIVLCELSFMDPGGNWANRPYNSWLYSKMG